MKLELLLLGGLALCTLCVAAYADEDATVTVLLCGPHGPEPFNYDSAVAWANETVKSDVPEAKRIYVFGPGVGREPSVRNGKPPEWPVEARRIFSHDQCPTVRSMLVHWDGFEWRGRPVLFVYRRQKPTEAIYTISGDETTSSTFPLKPGDAVWIRLRQALHSKPQPN